MSAPSDAMTLRRERAAGISILRRRSASARAPIVFLHGIGSDASSWRPLVEALDPALDAIVWTAPGYGDSDPVPTASPSPRDYGLKLEGLLDALELKRAALVGHSLGALFAGCFAADHPERVTALALLSPALGYRVQPGEPLPPNVQARVDDLARLGAAAFARRAAPRLVFRPDTKPELVARIEAAMATIHPVGYGQAVRALGAGDLLAAAPRVAARTLVAIGAEDAVTLPENAERLRSALRRPGPFLLVPGAGHALPQEAPLPMAEALADFIRTSADA